MFFGQFVSGQNDGCSDYKNKKSDEKYLLALQAYKSSANSAIEILEEITSQDAKHTDSHFMLGVLYFEKAEQIRKQKTPDTLLIDEYLKKAIKEQRKVIKLCDSYHDFEAHFYIGQILYLQKKHHEAKKELDYYTSRTKKFIMRKEAELLRDDSEEYLRLKNNPIEFNPQPINEINTSDDESVPLLAPDDSYLYYTQRKYTSKTAFNELFMYSKKLSPKGELDPKYTQGIKMPLPFNDGRNQGAASLTVNNRTMYVSVCNIERGSFTSYQNCDIFVSERLKGEWSVMQRLTNSINGIMTWEGHPSISSDGKVLYFSSIRDDSYGKADIYRSVKNENGKWKPAENLGPMINTAGEEFYPFIHPDGKTLYFASNGRAGMGGFDIFFSQLDSVQGWSKPQNIGYPLNTEEDETAFSVSTNGELIYFASKALSKKNNFDIYTTLLPDAAKPGKVLLVKGRVIGDDGDTLSHVRIVVQNIYTKATTQGSVEDSTGHYAVSVPVENGDRFVLSAEKHGYVYYSEHINPDEKKYIPPSTLDIEVKKIKRGKTYILESVFFETNSYELSEAAKTALNSTADMMSEYLSYTFEIHGHTDSQGGETSNYSLSYNRAKAVYDYLIQRGVDKNRLDFKAFGESKPIDSNTSSGGRSMNRRVEVLVK